MSQSPRTLGAAEGRRQLWPIVVPALIGASAIAIVFASGEAAIDDVGGVVLVTGIAALGSAIQRHQPGNRIAYLLQAVAVAILVGLLSEISIDSDLANPGVWDYLALIGGSLAVAGMVSIFMILFLFPDGHFLSKKWQWAGWLSGSLVAVYTILSAFATDLGDPWDLESPTIPNPIGFIPVGFATSVQTLAAPLFLVLAIGGVAAIVIRYRRSEELVRTQIKWVVYAAVLTVVTFPVALGPNELLSSILWFFVLGSVPVAITLAITRYKPFEIDRLISRTISYTLVVGVLAMVFFSTVVLVSRLFDSQDNFAIAGATLATAALFNPLRRRVQAGVDRKFNRSSYEARLVAEEFADRLRQPHNATDIADLLNDTVIETLKPRASGVWLAGSSRK